MCRGLEDKVSSSHRSSALHLTFLVPFLLDPELEQTGWTNCCSRICLPCGSVLFKGLIFLSNEGFKELYHEGDCSALEYRIELSAQLIWTYTWFPLSVGRHCKCIRPTVFFQQSADKMLTWTLQEQWCPITVLLGNTNQFHLMLVQYNLSYKMEKKKEKKTNKPKQSQKQAILKKKEQTQQQIC